MEEQINQSTQEEYFKIDTKKIFLAFWNKKSLIFKVFICTVLFFVLITFFMKKIWAVDADLYINKSNSTNYSEINPFAIEELGIGLISNQNPLADEIELIKSPLVIQKVIEENDLRYKKLFGLIPTKKTGEYISVKAFLNKRNVGFENKNGTSILKITYKSKNKELAYNVVNSIIKNYIELHKEINSEKSKSDKMIIENEYHKAKENLNKKVSSASGLPTASISGTGNLAAMSAFSSSAQNAMANLKGQYLAHEKSHVEISEEASKVTQLASKLEWAKMVEEMSDTSKVLVIKEPSLPKDWEYASPDFKVNALVGIIMGLILAFWAVIISEVLDKKLTYLNLGDNIIYDLDKEYNKLAMDVMSNSEENKAFIFFENIPTQYLEKFKQFKNTIPLKADISNTFIDSLKKIDSVVIFASIHNTDKEKYKLIKKSITNLNKNIMYEVLV